ncbi:f-boxkelch-repeat protein, partial [Nicotiana attenuata]
NFANPSLPNELITDILERLHVKSLLRFKCVSKDWLSIISSPQFVNTHLTLSANDYFWHRLLLKLNHNFKHCFVSSIFDEAVIETFDLDFPIKNPDTSFDIMGSVNGLICLLIGLNRLVLWNPSTRKFKQLPDLMPKHTDDYNFNYGFEYDEVHDDYKVVGIFCTSTHGYVCVYSLKTNSWRRLGDMRGGLLYNGSAKLVHGKFHWATMHAGGWGVGSIDLVEERADGWGITSIDLVDEKCRKVLGVLGSELTILCNYDRTRDDMWVMKEYGVKESWIKLYTFRYPNVLKDYMISPPLCMSNEGEILHVVGSTFAIYNPVYRSFTSPKVTNIDGSVEAKLYIESLVCPISQNEPVTQH